MFDRETKREKIIESKLRELRLKAKTSAKPDTETNQEKHALLVEAETRLIAEAEKEFDELVAKLVNTIHFLYYLPTITNRFSNSIRIKIHVSMKSISSKIDVYVILYLQNKKLTNDDEDELGREIADELQDRTVDQ